MKTEISKKAKVTRNGKVFDAHYVVESYNGWYWIHMLILTEFGTFIESLPNKSRDEAVYDFWGKFHSKGFEIAYGK